MSGFADMVIHQENTPRGTITKIGIRLAFDDMDFDCVADPLISLGFGRQEVDAIKPSVRDIRKPGKRLARVHGVDYVRDIAVKKLALGDERAGRVLRIPVGLVKLGDFKPGVDLLFAMIDGRIRKRKAFVEHTCVFCFDPLFRPDGLRKAVFVEKPPEMVAPLHHAEIHFSGSCRIGKVIVRMTQKTMEETAEAVVTGEEILAMRALAAEVPICDEVLYYAVDLVSNTHPASKDCAPSAKKYLKYGASPRAAQGLVTCAKVRALMDGRYNVSYEDISALAYPILRHRIKINYTAINDKLTVDDVIGLIVKETKKGN